MDDFDFFRLYKTLHIIFVAVLAGGIGIETVIGPMLPKLTRVEEIRPIARLMVIAETFMILPGAIFLAGFGYAAAARANIALDTTWLLIAQVLLLLSILVSLLVLRPAALRLQKSVTNLPDGASPADLAAQLKNPVPGIAGAVLLIFFFFIIYLMVAKPAW